jgi:hypothetical protein
MSVMQSEPAAQERMASLSEMLSAQTRAAYAAAAAYAGTGRSKARRRAVIAGMRQIAMVNFDLLMEFELTVLPTGTLPYPATTQQLISPWQARQLRPGLTVDAFVDPWNPATVWLGLENLGLENLAAQ